jgi:hypothetical protein
MTLSGNIPLIKWTITATPLRLVEREHVPSLENTRTFPALLSFGIGQQNGGAAGGVGTP